MKTDTTERALESLIVEQMTTGAPSPPAGSGFSEEPEPFVGLHNWLLGDPADYGRAWTVDITQLRQFLAVTQPQRIAAFDLAGSKARSQARHHRRAAPRHQA